MTKMMRPVLLSFSMLAFAGAGYAAQDNAKQQQNAASGGSMMKSQSSQRGMQGNAVSVQQFKDMKVVGQQGDEVGEISDVVLNLANHRVQAVVLESGGWFGIGGNNYAFPMSDFKRGKQQDQLVLNMSKEQLKNKQGFEKSKWPGMDDQYWTQSGKASAGGTQFGGKQQQAAQQGQLNLIRASELKGKQVQDKSGQQVGEVQDVIIGLNGEMRSLVVDMKDGGQAHIPAKQLSRGTGDNLVVGMNAEQIRSQAKQSKQSHNRGAAAGGASSDNAAKGR